jgi:hypothetical protein
MSYTDAQHRHFPISILESQGRSGKQTGHLSEVANNSSRVLKQRHVQNLADQCARLADPRSHVAQVPPGISENPVIQAVLDKTRLNVAGEDHGVSDRRRDSEIAFSLERAGGAYWQEGHFPAADGQDPADSAILLMHYELAVIKTLAANWAEAPKPALLKSEIQNVDHYKGKLEGGHAYTDQVARSELLDEALDDNDVDEVNKILKDFADDPAIATYEEASARRGKAMHDAAEAQFQTLGVWKIGDAHVTEINALPNVNPAYNLMTQADFDAEYAQWKTQQEANAPPPPPPVLAAADDEAPPPPPPEQALLFDEEIPPPPP